MIYVKLMSEHLGGTAMGIASPRLRLTWINISRTELTDFAGR